MLIITIAIFFTMAIIVRSYKFIDNNRIDVKDIIKAGLMASVAIFCIILRETYFALPEGSMVSMEYLTYRSYLIWGFLAFMAYIVRLLIYTSVYIYRSRG
jgi:anaerobic C4-dicarboxylate transporter